jgi:hypothetical protein
MGSSNEPGLFDQDRGGADVQSESEVRSPLPEIIKSEVNLLLLPFFALSRKGLEKKTSTVYKKEIIRDGEKLEIFWQVTANTKYGYPGPFDKEVHKVIEQILTERLERGGIPLRNPIPIGSIYEICRRMGISSQGKNYRNIKEALRRIALTGIESRGAFYSKEREKWVEDVFHLYDRVIFKGEQLSNGVIADTNYLFLSSWYLENLNALYVKPLDYTYYRFLKSTIAQRLYELLGVKFYGALQSGQAYVCYKYSTLCDLLPITRQSYLSRAKEKLEPAHAELRSTKFLRKVIWRRGRSSNDWLILYYPGERALEEAKRWGLKRSFFIQSFDETRLESEPSPQESLRPGRRVRDLSEIELQGLVQQMIEVLGDERSRGFYTKVAQVCPSQVIYRILSEVKDEWLQGRVRRSKGALFTDKIKRYCQERGIDLGLRKDKG